MEIKARAKIGNVQSKKSGDDVYVAVQVLIPRENVNAQALMLAYDTWVSVVIQSAQLEMQVKPGPDGQQMFLPETREEPATKGRAADDIPPAFRDALKGEGAERKREREPLDDSWLYDNDDKPTEGDGGGEPKD